MKTEPQTPDNSCPHCGAEETNSSGLRIYWACGSHATFGCDMKPTPLCREREAHNKTRGELAKAMSMIDRDMECEAENQKLRELCRKALCTFTPIEQLRAELEALNTTDK